MATTETLPALSPMLQALREHLLAIRQEARTLTALTEAQWRWSPERGRWSLVQCVEHLNKTGTELMPRFESALEQLRTAELRSEGPFRYSLFERGFIRMLSPNPPFKFPVPPMFEPAMEGAAPTAVLTEFLALQEGLLRFVEAANGWDLTQAKVTSPISQRLQLCVGAYLEAIVAHERYHWLQVQALRADPGYPTE